MDRKTPLEPGYRVEIISGYGQPTDTLQKKANNFLSDMALEARGAGYKFRLLSVSANSDKDNLIIAYELAEDPLFRPPM